MTSPSDQAPTVVGIIADTHGLVRPEALAALAGAAVIVHAGDVGSAEVLQSLARIAPLTAVRGNNDHGPWAEGLPEDAALTVSGVGIYVLHDLAALEIEPKAAGFAVVVTGHSHRPLARRGDDGVLYINPGSAGPRRFSLPIGVGRLEIGAAGELTYRQLPFMV